MAAKSLPTSAKMKAGLRTTGLVSAKSKTSDPACSQAMSDWKRKDGPGLTALVASILGKCRAKAHALRQARMHRAAGSEAKAQHLEHRVASTSVKTGSVSLSARMEKARALRAERAAKGTTAAPRTAATIRSEMAAKHEAAATTRSREPSPARARAMERQRARQAAEKAPAAPERKFSSPHAKGRAELAASARRARAEGAPRERVKAVVGERKAGLSSLRGSPERQAMAARLKAGREVKRMEAKMVPGKTYGPRGEEITPKMPPAAAAAKKPTWTAANEAELQKQEAFRKTLQPRIPHDKFTAAARSERAASLRAGRASGVIPHGKGGSRAAEKNLTPEERKVFQAHTADERAEYLSVGHPSRGQFAPNRVPPLSPRTTRSRERTGLGKALASRPKPPPAPVAKPAPKPPSLREQAAATRAAKGTREERIQRIRARANVIGGNIANREEQVLAHDKKFGTSNSAGIPTKQYLGGTSARKEALRKRVVPLVKSVEKPAAAPKLETHSGTSMAAAEAHRARYEAARQARQARLTAEANAPKPPSPAKQRAAAREAQKKEMGTFVKPLVAPHSAAPPAAPKPAGPSMNRPSTPAEFAARATKAKAEIHRARKGSGEQRIQTLAAKAESRGQTARVEAIKQRLSIPKAPAAGATPQTTIAHLQHVENTSDRYHPNAIDAHIKTLGVHSKEHLQEIEKSYLGGSGKSSKPAILRKIATKIHDFRESRGRVRGIMAQ